MTTITNEEFAALGWPAQCKVLRDLDNAASNCSGKTAAEADRKRKPFTKRENELRKIHDQQQADWIAKGAAS